MQDTRVFCPYCGEELTVFIDISVPRQTYIEDCQVCCRPITFSVHVDTEGLPLVDVRREDD